MLNNVLYGIIFAVTVCLWYKQNHVVMVHTFTNLQIPVTGAPLAPSGTERAELHFR